VASVTRRHAEAVSAACRRSLDLSVGACLRRRSRTVRAADHDHEVFRFFARRQAKELGIEAIVVLEPMRRDSGPAIVAAFSVSSGSIPMPSRAHRRSGSTMR
jgi:hypothetical protein